MGPARSPHGFTLIEIIIILAVLGLLAATLMPAVLDFIEDGRVDVAVQDLRDIKTAFVALAVDRGAFPPDDDPLPAAGAGDGDINGSNFHGLRFQGTADTRHWNGPYIDREVKTHPWGGHYVYERGCNVINLKVNAVFHCDRSPSPGRESAGNEDIGIVLAGTGLSPAVRRRIDEILDDGCANSGRVQVEGATSCADFAGGVKGGWGTTAGGELMYVIVEDQGPAG